MSIYINGSYTNRIDINDKNIAMIKLNGAMLFPNPNQIDLSYMYNTLYLHGYYGEYELVYANNNGPIDGYDRIGVVQIQNGYGELPHLAPLNTAPEGATKIIVREKNTTNVLTELPLPYNLVFESNSLGEKLYSFGALSDVHIDGDGNDEASAAGDLARALQFFNENADLVCISGDLCITSGYAELSLFKDIVDSNATIPVYASRGNHDCSYTLEEFETYTGGSLYFERTYNNDVFLFIGMNAEHYGDNLFTTEELDWLETKLETYKNQRVFLFFHVFMDDTCGNINGYYPYSNMDISSAIVQRFNALMVKYRNVIYFSGHSHLEFYCQRLGPNANIYSNGSICHRVHIPSCAKPRVNYKGSSDYTYSFHDGSEGYLVDVYKDHIVLKGINFIKGKFVPIAHYVLNTSEFEIIDNNLYDYLSMPYDTGWINSSNGYFSKTTYGDHYTYLEIEPNTTYRVTKMLGSRFAVATIDAIPTTNIQLSNVISNNNSKELTITSGENDKYLMIYYWYVNTDGDTDIDYRRSITVENISGNEEIDTDNLLILSKNNASWVSYAGSEASATYNNNNTITINANGSDSWGLNISQPGLTLKAGTTYRLSCDNLESSTWISINNKDNMMIRRSLPSIEFTPSDNIVDPVIYIWVDTGIVYTNTTWNMKIVEVIDESNLWSKAVKLNNLYPDSGTGNFETGNLTYSCAYISCEPNTEYKITRTMDGYRFRVAETTLLPQQGAAYKNLIKADDSKDINYTTSSDANYLVIYYGGSSETLDRDELFNDIVVTKVSTENESINLFETSAILYSNSGSQYASGKNRAGVVYTYETGSENVTLNGTPTESYVQGFKVTNTLTAGKTYKLYAEVVSGSVDLGTKDHSLLIELKTNYTGDPLCSCYMDSTNTSTMPEIGTYTPTSDMNEWFVMIAHRSSEVVYSNYTIAIHVEEVVDSTSNLIPNFTGPNSTTAGGISYNFVEGTNKLMLNGTSASSEHIYSNNFKMDLEVGKTYAYKFNIISGTIDASAHEDSYYDKNLLGIDNTGASTKIATTDDVMNGTHLQRFTITQEYEYYQIDVKCKSKDIYTNVEIEIEVFEVTDEDPMSTEWLDYNNPNFDGASRARESVDAWIYNVSGDGNINGIYLDVTADKIYNFKLRAKYHSYAGAPTKYSVFILDSDNNDAIVDRFDYNFDANGTSATQETTTQLTKGNYKVVIGSDTRFEFGVNVLEVELNSDNESTTGIDPELWSTFFNIKKYASVKYPNQAVETITNANPILMFEGNATASLITNLSEEGAIYAYGAAVNHVAMSLEAGKTITINFDLETTNVSIHNMGFYYGGGQFGPMLTTGGVAGNYNVTITNNTSAAVNINGIGMMIEPASTSSNYSLKMTIKSITIA